MRRKRETTLGAMLAFTAVAIALGGCGGDGPAATAAHATAPPSEWKPWVLSDPGDVASTPRSAVAARAVLGAVPAAGSPEAEALAARWDVDPAPAPWIERAMELVSRRPKDPPYSSRAYAYVAVAMHDAAVAAAHGREVDGDSGPDAHAAIAGAASRVLAHLFPEQPAERLEADAEEAARARIAAGEDEVAALAGLELGREVAKRVIARADADGSQRRWDGSRPPETAAYWRPPPGSAARPVQPLAGTWGTWVIGSAEPFRSPPPPRFGTPEFRRGIDAVLAAARELTPEQRKAALFWAGGEGTPLPAGIWEGVMVEYLRGGDLSLEEEARAFALVSVAMADAGVAAWDTKYAYWSPRPENAIRDSGVDPDFEPLVPTPFFPAYTSGHATYSAAAAEVLSHLFPEDADEWHRKAREAADARVWGGIHWPYDSDEGLKTGRRIGELIVDRARDDGANP